MGGGTAGTIMGHVHLHVGSLEGADAFYHRALGFDKMAWSYPGALLLSAGGYHHHLGTNVWSPGPAPSVEQAQLLEWQLIVPSDEDVAAIGRSVRSAGYATSDADGSLLVTDPWGARLRIGAEK